MDAAEFNIRGEGRVEAAEKARAMRGMEKAADPSVIARSGGGRIEGGKVGTGDGQEAWETIKQRLATEYGHDVYKSWFVRIILERCDDGRAVLSVPTKFLLSWIREHYLARIRSLFTEECAGIGDVDLVVRGPERRPAAALKRADGAAVVRRVEPDRPEKPKAVEGTPLERRYAFETFAVSRSNTVAFAAARQIAEAPNNGPAPFNPLFIHGGCGRGKTHLLHAIAWESASNNPERKVLHLSAEQFMCRFVAALRGDDALGFKDRLRQIDLLLIDDLQFLNGKASQREFAHTLDALLETCRQVVIVADSPPMALEGIEERVRSRLSGGLVVEVTQADVELRRKILGMRIAAIRRTKSDFELDGDVIDLIANRVAGNGRDVEGALNRLVAHADYTSEPITTTLAEHLIRDLVFERAEPVVRVDDIQRIVAKRFNITQQDMVSKRRTRAIARPRQISMFLCKVLTPRSLPEIGKLFGGRDHTTVIYAIRKIQELINRDAKMAETVADLKRACLEQGR